MSKLEVGQSENSVLLVGEFYFISVKAPNGCDKERIYL